MAIQNDKLPLPAGITWAKRLGFWMDNAISIPGTRFRLGADAIASLHPLAGDILSGLVLLFFIGLAVRYQLPMMVVGKMLLNFVLDVAIGAVPFLGDLGDVAFKATARNANLLEQAYLTHSQREPEGTRFRGAPFEKAGPTLDVAPD
jgi:Domain of unknown function (DUF4112)